ncbi:hypothetical protein GMRT_16379 [Giardia muris]|uniref:Uncharacterized protein n=1 Tax=Giardia muris TaxID=5742 RepID=A0A4Z1SLZ2_GIAMU|nr:hypothetical protein GMRT_16379 [Giardia muris]|eukprot:TNJ26560.1 hypothetical protein GMRT_16379 [Giardia muris]
MPTTSLPPAPPLAASLALQNVWLLQGEYTFEQVYGFTPGPQTFLQGTPREKACLLHHLLLAADPSLSTRFSYLRTPGTSTIRFRPSDVALFREHALEETTRLSPLAGYSPISKAHFLAFSLSNLDLFLLLSTYAVREQTKRLYHRMCQEDLPLERLATYRDRGLKVEAEQPPREYLQLLERRIYHELQLADYTAECYERVAKEMHARARDRPNLPEEQLESLVPKSYDILLKQLGELADTCKQIPRSAYACLPSMTKDSDEQRLADLAYPLLDLSSLQALQGHAGRTRPGGVNLGLLAEAARKLCSETAENEVIQTLEGSWTSLPQDLQQGTPLGTASIEGLREIEEGLLEDIRQTQAEIGRLRLQLRGTDGNKSMACETPSKSLTERIVDALSYNVLSTISSNSAPLDASKLTVGAISQSMAVSTMMRTDTLASRLRLLHEQREKETPMILLVSNAQEGVLETLLHME